MSFELPDINALSAKQLLDDLVRRIPRTAPQWTEQNPSDPGITLLEMLAWIGEATTYQANIIPAEAYRSMLRLVLGLAYGTEARPYAELAAKGLDPLYAGLQQTLQQAERGQSLNVEALSQAVYAFRSAPYLALTQSDIEQLAIEANQYVRDAMPGSPVVLEANVAHNDVGVELSLVVGDPATSFLRYVREAGADPSTVSYALDVEVATDKGETSGVVELVARYIRSRQMLGNPISIRAASLCKLQVECTVRCLPRQRRDVVADKVASAIVDRVQPYAPPPRQATRNRGALTRELIQSVIAGIEGIHSVEDVRIDASSVTGERGPGRGPGLVIPTGINGHPFSPGGKPAVVRVQVTANEMEG
ncbi:hypothetical protein [Trinickia dinghuensis]|uniref:Baseplate protein J-like domain-containing protein n=1 Tax=Trinickia dinghuensis TaxID=2291023 RepID=A0A3D8JW33_9BURK|nr:hypothetical protein [Trinickia dinghuensis]RDU97338.1 hypothetical protein DWV00_19095 [Trinickia dinghuensis]